MPLTSIRLNNPISTPEPAIEPIPPLASITSRISSAVGRCFNSRYTIGSIVLGSLAVVIVSAVSLHSVFDRYVNNCVNELNNFSSDLSTCRAPYQTTITTCEVLTGVFCGVLGIIIQKLWEFTSPEPNKPEREMSALEKAKIKVAEIQNSCSYEFHLGLGYLYNGLWVNTSTIPSWEFYFNAQAAAIGLAATSLGMFTRLQYRAIQQQLSQAQEYELLEDGSSFRIKDHWKIIVISGSGVIILCLPLATPHLFSGKTLKVTREVCMMILGRPLGQLFSNWMNKQKSRFDHHLARRIISILHAALKKSPACLVGLGYTAYIATSSSLTSRLSGMTLIGFAEGTKDAYYQYEEIQNRPSVQGALSAINMCRQFVNKTWYYMKEYWRTAALISFAIVLKKISFLQCYDVSNYNCPVAFELSGNYVNIDGNGVNIAIATGLANYYAIKLFKWMRTHSNNYVRKFSETYLHMVDKYQFDLLSMMPYAIINSGEYIPDYNAYACYNPPPLLILIGFTMGTYNEKIHAGKNDPFRPVFTDVSAVTNSLPI